jgi:hypothetical protein
VESHGARVTTEPSGMESRGPLPGDTRWHRRPPMRRDEVRSRGTCSNAGALPFREAGFGVVGHAAALEPT